MLLTKASTIRSVGLLVAGILLMLSFQNCSPLGISKVQFTSKILPITSEEVISPLGPGGSANTSDSSRNNTYTPTGAEGPSSVFVPLDANLINVKIDCQAKGDGQTDDTQAIQNCINNNLGTDRTLFFPAGVYIVSDQLIWKDTSQLPGDQLWAAHLQIQGSGYGQTVIRLKEHAIGFQQVGSPRAVIYTASVQATNCSTFVLPKYISNGGGNCAYINFIFDLSIEIGQGNPGAVGLDFAGSNRAAVENVRIRSVDGQGFSGLNLNRQPGPLLISNVAIDGFNIGILIDDTEGYHVTLENITLTNQKVLGIKNIRTAVSLRNLISTNSVPAIQTQDSLFVISDSTLRGGSSTAAAIMIPSLGYLHALRVQTTDYEAAIDNVGIKKEVGFVQEYVSGDIFSRHKLSSINSLLEVPKELRSLALYPRSTPTFYESNPQNWAKADGTTAADIQYAIDSGATTVYLPFANYNLKGTNIYVRKNVRRIIGYMTRLSGGSFIIDSSVTHPVVIERIWTDNNQIIHQSNSDLAIRHVRAEPVLPKDYSGDLFLDGSCCKSIVTNGRNVWARQLNIEGANTRIENVAGQIWVLGYKEEDQENGLIVTSQGGRTEVLGAWLFSREVNGINSTNGGNPSGPVILNQHSSVSISFMEANWGYHYQTLIEEVQQNNTGIDQYVLLHNGANSWGGNGKNGAAIVPLYVGYPSN